MVKLDKRIKQYKAEAIFNLEIFPLTHLRRMFTGRVVDLHLQWVKLSSANPLPGSRTNFTF